MTLAERESPKGKRVSLFVTCMVDMLFPQTGMSVVKVLEHAGVEVDFPMAQTCCGQPAFNAGYRHEARQVAEQFLRAFADAQVIVTPSGSCAAMVSRSAIALSRSPPRGRVTSCLPSLYLPPTPKRQDGATQPKNIRQPTLKRRRPSHDTRR